LKSLPNERGGNSKQFFLLDHVEIPQDDGDNHGQSCGQWAYGYQ